MKLKIFAVIAALFLICACFVACDEGKTPDTPDNGGNTGDNGSNQEPEKPKYTVTWKDENGNTLSSAKVEEGKAPTPHAYEKADTAEWDYTVDGWSATEGGEVLDTVPNASADATYYAVVSQVKRKYTVTFNTGDGSAVAPVTVEYGSAVNMPADAPTLDGHRFVAWCSDSACETEAVWPLTVTGNVTIYAKWNEQVDIGAYLSALLNGFKLNPYSFIPEAMLPTYSANLIDPDDIVTDYSNFVNVSDITMRGFGEQWNMVLDNIEQSSTFFNALTVVEGLTATSVSAFNNYLDKNPGDTAHHNFKSGIYSVTVDFDGEVITYVLDYTATFPVLGEQTAQIAMEMDIETGEKNVRVQLGDANAIHYVMGDGYYEFAIKYLGVRRAYFSIAYDEDNNLSGHIYEYLTVNGVGIKSAADFYFVEDYVAVVGNKADGIIGFNNYICELYDAEDGRMIGYEVREEKSVLRFDTLWFNLDQFSGITSIKYREKTDSQEAAFFLNGSNTAWKTKKVSTLNPSRRYDIEFRIQYFYSYDPATEKYTAHKVEVPMMFVQEGNLGTLTDDIKAENKINVALTESSSLVTMLIGFYDTTVDVFITNKELVTEDVIVAFIGDKKTFA